MKPFHIILSLAAVAVLALTGCSKVNTASSYGASLTNYHTVKGYDEMTMDLDPNPISYTIDVSTPQGKMKLNKLSLRDAQELALVEAIMANSCATIFQPQYTQLVKNGKVLRVTVYGYPARYRVDNSRMPRPSNNRNYNIEIH